MLNYRDNKIKNKFKFREYIYKVIVADYISLCVS